MKKGQTGEIMGVLVIVVLLLVLVTIYIRFASQPESDVVTQTRFAMTSSHLVNSMLKYSVCEGKSLEDAIAKCAKGGDICGQDSCRLMEIEIRAILNATLKGELANERVALDIKEKGTEDSLLRIEPKACKKITFADAKIIDLFPGKIYVKLGQCYS